MVAVSPTSDCHRLLYRVSRIEHGATAETWLQIEAPQFRDFNMFLQCLRHLLWG